MSEPRLKARLLVGALLRQAAVRDRPGAVLRRGDPDAGAVTVVLRDRADRFRLLTQSRTPEHGLAWAAVGGAEPIDQGAVDAYLDRAARRDPDLWVVEFEGADLTLPFEGREL